MRPTALLFLSVVLWLPSTAGAANALRLVPSPAYPTLAAAVAASQPGDAIQVDALAYGGDPTGVIISIELTIRGVNGRPSLPPLETKNAAVVIEDAVLSGLMVGPMDTATPWDTAVTIDSGGLDTGWWTPSDTAGWTDPDTGRVWPVPGAAIAGSFGLLASGGSVTMNRVILGSTWAKGLVANGTAVTLTDVQAADFTVQRPVVVTDGASLKITRGIFRRNDVGAVSAITTPVTVSGSTFGRNQAVSGADLNVDGGGSVAISGTTFSQSRALQSGGAIYVSGAVLQVTNTSFTSTTAADAGGAVYLTSGPTSFGAPSSLTDVQITGASAQVWGGGVALDGVELVVSGLDLADVSADYGGAIGIDGGALSGAQMTASGVSAIEGGIIHVQRGTVDLSHLGYFAGQGEVAAVDGGGVHATASVVSLSYVTSDWIEASGDGGLVWAAGGAVTLTGGRSLGSTAGGVGALVASSDAEVRLERHVSSLGLATYGGVVHADGGSITLIDSSFHSNTATETGGVLEVSGAAALTVVRNRFCINHADKGAGVLEIAGGGGDSVRNNAFIDNSSGTHGVVRIDRTVMQATDGSSLALVNNTFVGAATPGATVSVLGGSIEITNDVFDGPGLALHGAGDGLTATGGFNLFDDDGAGTTRSTLAGFPGPNAVFADPLYQGYTARFCESILYLSAGSPARNTGDPAYSNVDGNRSDIGAYGGLDSGLVDGDADDWLHDLDCDDDDAAVHPGETEVPYDRIDQDCDGADLTDVDGDGVPKVDGEPPLDCNDEDEAVYPGATEIPYDGIDQDCDGSDLMDVDGDGFVGGSEGPDCDDTRPSVNPDAAETPYDGIDQDCDGADLVDVDADGFEGELAGGSDCDDEDAGIHPGMTEIWYDTVDQDCDGNDRDQDLDGYDADTVDGDDCNDRDPRVHPGAVDHPNDDVDQDCDETYATSVLAGGGGCRQLPVAPGVAGLWGLLLVAGATRRRRFFPL